MTGVIGEILGAICGLYVANSIPSWHIPVITESYVEYIPYANATIIALCMAHILMYLSPWYRLRCVFEGLSRLISLVSLYVLFTIFPFDFAPINRMEINSLLQFAFIIALCGLGIALIITVIRLIRGKP